MSNADTCSFCKGSGVVHGEQCIACAGKGYPGDPRPAPQPAPSGDEAKERVIPDSIADRWLHLHTMMPPAFSDLCQRPECDHARHLHVPSCGHVNHDGVANCACAGFVGSAMTVADALLGAVREAYAAGKADRAREVWAECELTVRDSCICQVAECSCSARLRDIARAIARRGSEGK